MSLWPLHLQLACVFRLVAALETTTKGGLRWNWVICKLALHTFITALTLCPASFCCVRR